MYRLAALAVIASLGVWQGQAQTVSVSATASHPIPTTLWGQMFEDISHSGDGGLYAELLQNRALQQVTPNTAASLNAWSAINGGQISVVADSVPVSNSLPNSLRFTVPAGRTGQVGFANSGFFGMKIVASSTYKGSFFVKFPTASSFTGNLIVGLRTTSGSTIVSQTVPIRGASTSWQQISVSLTPRTTPPSTDNQFFVTIDGAAASGQTINFAMFSLFPPTFKNRANGMRDDIATALAEMKPKFFRFPGGNNLEGQTVPTRWQWNATIGSLLDRPGRAGDWGYINTDGLGLLEYLLFCEDLGMEPIMAVWAGFALGGTSVAQNGLQPYIQQAIDQINFVIGDPATSAPAARRAALGRAQPFKLTYVEIGNEDFFASDTYTYRWPAFVNALRGAFPNLKFIATSNINSPVLSPNPAQWDHHVYQTPTWFAQNSFFYDDMPRNGVTFFEGEYAAISTNPNDIFGSPANGRLTFSTMQSASGEAAYMIGMERNSDIVFAASYAPLLGHVAGSQWTPNLIAFDTGNVYRSASYFVQKLFSTNMGNEYIPSTLPSRTGTAFWGVTRNTATGEIIIKVSNTVAAQANLTFVLPFANVATSGSLQVLTGAATASNSPTTPSALAPATRTITTGKTFTFAAAGFSVNVITIKAS
uniref:non-reducing end alpha-L-arabinofuranosidase n=1 Tax=Pleurotus sp. 'Florida' TaxID=188765 RepID=G0TES6_9AGAR|nr:alfa-L-arabinofuranosidase precursor [Pleurotus sp. 'Florida']CCC33069.1 alfa-L-arabinofuranosidase [Pleurotus sp. 'Florida']